MKPTNPLFLFLLAAILLSCSDDSSAPEDPNVIGGTTDLELTRVGNEYGVYVTVGEQQLEIQDSVYIEKNDNGLVTVRIQVAKIDDPRWVLIPDDLKDDNGNIDAEMTFRVTSEGIQDFYYSDHDFARPFTIVKYDASVGDLYEFTTGDGTKIVREVTERSEQDDWPLGFINIKTITTVEDAQIEGVDKVIYRTNHKFGLVYVEYLLVDGTPVKIDLLPWAMLQ